MESNITPIPPATERALPTITQRDIDELASNPIVRRLLTLWEARAKGMSDLAKGAALLSIFETFRASFELKKRSAGRAS